MPKWDLLLNRGKVWALVGTDAHGGFHLGSRLAIPVPSYKVAFALAGLGIDRRYSSMPEEAIRRGDFFVCSRGAGEPQQFEFFAMHGSEHFSSGSAPPALSAIHVRVRTDKLHVRLLLKRNGIVVSQSINGAIDLPLAEPGVYRAEAYLDDHPLLSPDVPWILSNPIFVGGVPNAELLPSSAAESSSHRSHIHALSLAEFNVEADRGSKAKYDGLGNFDYYLEKYSGGNPARSCALVRHQAIDLSQTQGFFIQALSSRYLRYLVELRSGNRRYYATFKLYPGKETLIRVPYEQFYQVGGGRGSLPLDAIDTVMIVMNEYNSRTDFGANLQIRQIGFY
jgi:hypothetical protein